MHGNSRPLREVRRAGPNRAAASGRRVGAALLVVALAGSCSSEESSGTSTSTTTSTSTVPASSTTASSTSTTSGVTTTVAPPLEQPAIWPAAGDYFDDPEMAAADFVVRVLGVPPTLGPFMAGDSRSGEIELLSPGGSASGRGVLFLRQLGPRSGWFITGIGNDEAGITVPAAGAAVAAGPVTVEGIGYGFEASISVTAYVAGDAAAVLDRVTTLAGSMESPGAFSVTLDLSAAAVGDAVMLLVRGGVGLETDPGELAAIVVVIG